MLFLGEQVKKTPSTFEFTTMPRARIKVIAPWRVGYHPELNCWNLQLKIKSYMKHNKKELLYVDANVLHRSAEGKY